MHSIHYGFRVLHTQQRQPAAVPSIRVNNYPSPPEHETELWTQTEQEITEGKVWEVTEPPAWIHPLYIREQGLKRRIIDDLSALAAGSINDVADSRLFSW